MNPVSGERIKQARQIRGMSPKQFARMVHCTPRELTRYETDLEQPPVDVLNSMAIVTSFPVRFFRQPPPPAFGLGSLVFHYDFEDAEGG